MLGWAGFDGGYRRSISFAQDKQNIYEDDPVVKPRSCFSTFGDEMLATVTGVALCGCFVLVGTPDRYFSATGWTGVNGVFTINADLPGNPANVNWNAIIGTITLQEFDGTSSPPSPVCDGTPIGVPFDVDVTLSVSCFASEGLGLQASIGAEGDFHATTAGQIFESTDHSPETYFQPGDVVPNIVACTTNIIGYYNNVAASGNLTVAIP